MQSGLITDIYLPKWFARNLPSIQAALLVAAALLRRRNLRGQRRRPTTRSDRESSQGGIR